MASLKPSSHISSTKRIVAVSDLDLCSFGAFLASLTIICLIYLPLSSLRSLFSSCSCSSFPFSWRLDCLCRPWFFPFYTDTSLLTIRVCWCTTCVYHAAAFRGMTFHCWFACLHFLPAALRCGLKPWLGVSLV